MTREHKLALIVGFSLVLVLGVLISDHFSKARNLQMAEDFKAPTPGQMGAATPDVRIADSSAVQPRIEPRRDLPDLPGVAHHSTDGAVAAGSSVPEKNPTIPLVEMNTSRFPAPHDQDGYHEPIPQISPPPPAPQIPVTRYDVKSGDTLYQISSKYYSDGKLWEKLRDYNKDKVGSSGTIHEGLTLLIPPKDVLLGKPYTPPTSIPSSNSSSTSKIDSKPSVSGAAGGASGDYKDYTVKEGDTLVGIARKMLNSGKRYVEIIDANKGTLSDPEALTVGMKLRIPAK